jgi:AraC-like DNA-binding protein
VHAIHLSLPCLALREYVRFYAQREVRTDGTAEVHVVPARAFPLLEFVFGDRFQVLYPGQGVLQTSPRRVVVGLQTHCHRQLRFQGAVECFVILFQPAGLQRLFRVPIQELTDQAYDADYVLGPVVSQFEAMLASGGDFGERVQAADNFLSDYALDARPLDQIGSAARQILIARGSSRISDVARDAGLSVRQLERRFHQQIGIHPKQYARIIRFEAALDTKARVPIRSWTDVAYALGYHDQMHMVHDFRALAGTTPTETLKVVEAVFRERLAAIRLGRGFTNMRTDLDVIL